MLGISDKNTIKTPHFLQISHFWTLLTFLIILMKIVMARNALVILHRSQWFQKCIIWCVILTNTWSRHSNPPKLQFLDIVGIPDHPEDDQRSWKPFRSISMVLSISKRFHMWGYNDIWPTRKANANLPTLWNVTGASLLVSRNGYSYLVIW